MTVEEVLEPTIGCKHPIVASGATPMGALVAHPDRKLVTRKKYFYAD
jgi:hypothetical protein